MLDADKVRELVEAAKDFRENWRAGVAAGKGTMKNCAFFPDVHEQYVVKWEYGEPDSVVTSVEDELKLLPLIPEHYRPETHYVDGYVVQECVSFDTEWSVIDRIMRELEPIGIGDLSHNIGTSVIDGRPIIFDWGFVYPPAWSNRGSTPARDLLNASR